MSSCAGRRFAALFLVLLLSCASCASIITGSKDSITVDSSPQGAYFTTNSGHSGTTPSKITIPDDLDLEVKYTLAGYQDAEAEVNSRMSAWILGNVLIGGIIGLVIDFATGNYQTHRDEVSVTLRSLHEPAPGVGL